MKLLRTFTIPDWNDRGKDHCDIFSCFVPAVVLEKDLVTGMFVELPNSFQNTIYYIPIEKMKLPSTSRFKKFQTKFRSSHPELFLEKDVVKTCSKFTCEHSCRSVISIKLQNNFIKIALRRGCSPVNLLHIFRTAFPRNTSGWLLLCILFFIFLMIEILFLLKSWVEK